MVLGMVYGYTRDNHDGVWDIDELYAFEVYVEMLLAGCVVWISVLWYVCGVSHVVW